MMSETLKSEGSGEVTQGRAWLEMTGGDFGRPVLPVQQSLFAEPDGFGTLDLFDTAGE